MSHSPVSRVIPRRCSACTVQGVFCPLPQELRTVFHALKTSSGYEKGKAAFHESEPFRGVFIVCQGSVKLVTGSRDGKLLLLRFAGPGEILGLAEATLGKPRHDCSAIAAEASVLSIIPGDTFMRFVMSSSEASGRLVVALSEQYRYAQQEAKFLAFGETATVRLARLLLEWSAERGELAEDGVHIPSHVTQTELAQSIGTTRETVTRVLGQLTHDGVIDRKPDEIVVHGSDLTRLGSY